MARNLPSTHTPPRAVRVPNELWAAAKATALDNQETVSEVINRELARYVARGIQRRGPLLLQTLERFGIAVEDLPIEDDEDLDDDVEVEDDEESAKAAS